MRRCLGCGTALAGASWSCPACGVAPVEKAGILHFPSKSEAASGAFSSEQFAELVALEEKSFWFQARGRLIVHTLRRCFPGAESLLDVGCGTGFVLAQLARSFPGMALVGADASAAGLAHAARRVPRAGLWRIDAGRLPVEEEFDILAAFDVLEHTEDDESVIAEMHRAVRPGGGIIVTVPQHPFLWSRADEYAGHRRRYRRGELRARLERAGFRPVFATGFMSLVLPLMAASRLRRREGPFDPTAEHRRGPLASSVLAGLAGLEFGMIRAGVCFPFGGSLLVAARREEAP